MGRGSSPPVAAASLSMADRGNDDLRGVRCNAFPVKLWWLGPRFASPERACLHTNRELLDHRFGDQQYARAGACARTVQLTID